MKKLLLSLVVLYLLIASTAQASSVKVLCDGKTYTGTAAVHVFVLQDSVAQDATIQKVIRNCTFKDAPDTPVVLQNTRNVLIENSTFENIRTHQAGVGAFGIGVTCKPTGSCHVDNVTVRSSTFRFIGADGIQMGVNDHFISNIHIENNYFEGAADVGENGIDIKGVDGPITVSGNTFTGFRPCDPGQDCSGSTGPGMTVHTGSSGAPNNVTIDNNDFINNTIGLSVSNANKSIVITNNRFTSNLTRGLQVFTTYQVSVINNTFDKNPVSAQIEDTPTSGGTCFVGGNSGSAFVYKNSNCKPATLPTPTKTPTKTPTNTLTPTVLPTKTPTLTPTTVPCQAS